MAKCGQQIVRSGSNAPVPTPHRHFLLIHPKPSVELLSARLRRVPTPPLLGSDDAPLPGCPGFSSARSALVQQQRFQTLHQRLLSVSRVKSAAACRNVAESIECSGRETCVIAFSEVTCRSFLGPFIRLDDRPWSGADAVCCLASWAVRGATTITTLLPYITKKKT